MLYQLQAITLAVIPNLKRMKKVLVFATLVLVAAACSPRLNTAADVASATYTVSYGMCQGYCTTAITAQPESVLVERTARDGQAQPPQRDVQPITEAQWKELVALLDVPAFNKLDSVTGCPGCADGGIATLTLRGKGASLKTIRFEEENPPAAVAPFVQKLKTMVPNKDTTAGGPSAYPPKKEMQTVKYDVHQQSGTVKNYVCSRGCYQYIILWENKRLYDANMPEAFKQDGAQIIFSANYTGTKTMIKKPGATDVPEPDFEAENIRITGIEARN